MAINAPANTRNSTKDQASSRPSAYAAPNRIAAIITAMARISSELGNLRLAEVAQLRTRRISREPANSSSAPTSATQPPGLTLISPPDSAEMANTTNAM